MDRSQTDKAQAHPKTKGELLLPSEKPSEKTSEIIGYHLDDENDWVAELACRHFQHVRHKPPFINRPWVITKEGRDKMLGYALTCIKCKTLAPHDY